MKRSQEYFRGCLIGGAIGDALGWPVEFLKYNEIVKKYGNGGIQDLLPTSTGKAEITDDTQMTLFTAEGIIRAETRGREKGISDPASVVYNAYLRWLATQGYSNKEDNRNNESWLYNVKGLHVRRAPGNSCLSALSSLEIGSIEKPINNSKGCGGVMRVAPVGLFYSKDRAFELASEFAALTHGHPSGYLSAGAFAYIIASIIEGDELEDSILEVLSKLLKYKGSNECYEALEKAFNFYRDGVAPQFAISMLGEGWIGEEALSISIYCSLVYKHDFRNALILAVNHSGDSDSTGAITGNILGEYLGVNYIPVEWVEKVELKTEIEQIADDLLRGYDTSNYWFNRYPGY